jgi:hypothetical protein
MKTRQSSYARNANQQRFSELGAPLVTLLRLLHNLKRGKSQPWLISRPARREEIHKASDDTIKGSIGGTKLRGP